MYRYAVIFCLQALLLKAALSYPVNGCYSNAYVAPTVASGNAVTTVTALPTSACGVPYATTQMAPLVTEIVPSLQFGDITVGGDIPIGGSIKVSGCFPVYGSVAVDGAVPSAGTAVINTGGGLVAQLVEPGCCRMY